MSSNIATIYKKLMNRLESIHGIPEPSRIYIPLHREKWENPEINITPYLWRSALIGVTVLTYFTMLYTHMYSEMFRVMEERMQLITYVGESTTFAQNIDFWTRETMFKESLVNLLDDAYPFKKPKQEQLETIMGLSNFYTTILKSKRIFTDSEFNLFYDRSTYDGDFHFNGIYGSIKAVIMDSIYYMGVTKDVTKEYKKFYSSLKKLDRFQERFYTDSAEISESLIAVYKEELVLVNILFCVGVTIYVLVVFVGFIRREQQLGEKKKYFLSLL